MQISRAHLKYTYSRFNFTRPSHAYYPENSMMPGKQSLHGETRMCYMSNEHKGVRVEPGTTNLIPLNKQKFEGWTAAYGATVTLTQNQAVPEWGALAATRIQTSGGTSTQKMYVFLGASVSDTPYTSSVYIKNTGATAVQIRNNLGGSVTVNPGAIGRFAASSIGNGSTWYGVAFMTLNAADSLDFIAWRPQVEVKTYCTSWIDGTRAPEILSVPGLPAQTGEIEVELEVTPQSKRQVAGESPTLLTMTRADGGNGLELTHAQATTEMRIAVYNDAGEISYKWFSDTLIPNGTRTLKISITTSAVTLYCDGVEIARIDNPALPSAWGRIYLGSRASGTNHADAIFGGIKMMAADSTVLSNILFTGYDFVRIARTIQL